MTSILDFFVDTKSQTEGLMDSWILSCWRDVMTSILDFVSDQVV